MYGGHLRHRLTFVICIGENLIADLVGHLRVCCQFACYRVNCCLLRGKKKKNQSSHLLKSQFGDLSLYLFKISIKDIFKTLQQILRNLQYKTRIKNLSLISKCG